MGEAHALGLKATERGDALRALTRPPEHAPLDLDHR
jgi:hypothetical protein